MDGRTDPATCVCPIDEAGDTAKYSGEHDSYYCPTCDVWLSPLCDETDCEYCEPRPEKPSMAQSLHEHVWETNMASTLERCDGCQSVRAVRGIVATNGLSRAEWR